MRWQTKERQQLSAAFCLAECASAAYYCWQVPVELAAKSGISLPVVERTIRCHRRSPEFHPQGNVAMLGHDTQFQGENDAFLNDVIWLSCSKEDNPMGI
ncbi:MAG TPA: hypothetical protein VF458_11065, partial [Ktedonobacteraceae bacterium]